MENKKIINSKGQGLMEYVIISSLIGILSIGVVSTFGKTIKERVEHMKEKVVDKISIRK